jgi:DNA-binding NarL/FixJ family response regulator
VHDKGRSERRLPWSGERRVRVLIVDDHALLRAGLAELLAHEPDLEVCGEAADVPSAIDRFADRRPDLVITDVVLRRGSGLELIEWLQREAPEVRIVVLSMHDAKLYAERALAAGAMGFVSKEQPAEDVIRAVRQLLLGKLYLPRPIANRVLNRVARGELQGPPIDNLSPRELQVLQLLGRGDTTRDIARQLDVSVKTVDTYREQLKRKLDLDTANELLRYAVTTALETGHDAESEERP